MIDLDKILAEPEFAPFLSQYGVESVTLDQLRALAERVMRESKLNVLREVLEQRGVRHNSTWGVVIEMIDECAEAIRNQTEA